MCFFHVSQARSEKTSISQPQKSRFLFSIRAWSGFLQSHPCGADEEPRGDPFKRLTGFGDLRGSTVEIESQILVPKCRICGHFVVENIDENRGILGYLRLRQTLLSL